MVLKLHSHAIAPRVRLVAAVCKELDVPYELVNVEVYKGEQKTPAYRAFQPFGQVPYLDDDGFILYESRAICRYIAKKHASEGHRLIPDGTDLKEEALFEQAASIEMSNFEPFAAGIAEEKIIKKHQGLPTNEERLELLVSTLRKNMDVYDVILGKQAYLAGDSISLADLFHLPYGAVVEKVGYSDVFETRPNVARWWKDITSRPSWQAVKDSA
ncbi:glutathione S-transferase [Leucogyrophana mollusca]|uniref:Glutathione S-transferase n=1 Tax=Leucogyrophana mollusca TaxID=85980 RepID=A0ACB8BFZ6_9AGAM|nr:glutathione S-transferase [Leucogyrophana mollusca]